MGPRDARVSRPPKDDTAGCGTRSGLRRHMAHLDGRRRRRAERVSRERRDPSGEGAVRGAGRVAWWPSRSRPVCLRGQS